jgi:hypothetical protein
MAVAIYENLVIFKVDIESVFMRTCEVIAIDPWRLIKPSGS